MLGKLLEALAMYVGNNKRANKVTSKGVMRFTIVLLSENSVTTNGNVDSPGSSSDPL